MVGRRALSGIVSALVILGVAELLAAGFGENSSPCRHSVRPSSTTPRTRFANSSSTPSGPTTRLCSTSAWPWSPSWWPHSPASWSVARGPSDPRCSPCSACSRHGQPSPAPDWAAAIPSLVGAVAGIATLRALIRRPRAGSGRRTDAHGSGRPARVPQPCRGTRRRGPARRCARAVDRGTCARRQRQPCRGPTPRSHGPGPADPRRRRAPHPRTRELRHRKRRLLPDRHGARRAAGVDARSGRCASTAWWIARSR